jgi:hypothetical protein
MKRNGNQWLLANVHRIQHEVRNNIKSRAQAVASLVGYGYTSNEAANIARRKTPYKK